MTIKPAKKAKTDKAGKELLAKMKALAKSEFEGRACRPGQGVAKKQAASRELLLRLQLGRPGVTRQLKLVGGRHSFIRVRGRPNWLRA